MAEFIATGTGTGLRDIRDSFDGEGFRNRLTLALQQRAFTDIYLSFTYSNNNTINLYIKFHSTDTALNIQNKLQYTLLSFFTSNTVSLSNVNVSTTPTTYGGIISTILGGVNPNPTSGGTSQTSDGIYTVKAGDTLSKIGAKLGIRWQDIAAWNNLKSPYLIQIGQILRISGGTLPASQNNNPVILQPSQLPPTLTNNNQTQQPQPQPTKGIMSQLSETFGVAPYVVGVVGFAVLLIILTPKNSK